MNTIFPNVSVILPSLNVSQYIEECITSVINQTLKNIEIICVDAGSTDGTLEIIREFEKKDSRIKLIISDKKSYGYQMNLGIDAARGKYIGIVETDDYINVNMYKILFEIAEKYKLDFIKSDFYRFVYDKNGKIELFLNQLGKDKRYYNRVLNPKINKNCFSFIMNTWSGIYNKEFLKKYNIRHNETPGASFQDTDFWFQTFSFAERAYFLDQPFYMNRRDNPNSSVYNKSKIFAFCDEYNYIYSVLEKNNEIKKQVLPAFQYYRYKHYMSSINRSSDEMKLEFIKKFSEDYNYSKSIGELDESLFTEGAKKTVHEIMEDPELYYKKIQGNKKNKVYNIENMYSYQKTHAPEAGKYAVSVIIPVYNAQKTINKCINSILNQTLKNIEIICVDDGSVDNSFDILKDFESKYEQIIIRSQQNQGAGKARNKAISLAQGEFIAFMDADDWYPEDDILETLYSKAKDNNVLICGGSFSYFKNGIQSSKYTGIYKLYTFNKEGIINYKDYQFDYGYHRFLYNTSMIKDNKIEFPNVRRFQDPPFFVKAMLVAEKFYAIPKVVYCYNKEDNKVNWTNEKINEAVEGIIENLELSRVHHLPFLHKITVEHLNIDFKNIIIEHLTKDNLKLFELIIKANNLIASDLLVEAGYQIDPDKQYVLKCIKEVFFNSSIKDVSVVITDRVYGKKIYTSDYFSFNKIFNNVKNEYSDIDKSEILLLKKKIDNIKNTWSYKIGRFITYIPRYIYRKIKNR